MRCIYCCFRVGHAANYRPGLRLTAWSAGPGLQCRAILLPSQAVYAMDEYYEDGYNGQDIQDAHWQ